MVETSPRAVQENDGVYASRKKRPYNTVRWCCHLMKAELSEMMPDDRCHYFEFHEMIDKQIQSVVTRKTTQEKTQCAAGDRRCVLSCVRKLEKLTHTSERAMFVFTH